MWCGKCYVAHPDDDFYVQVAEDDAGYAWKRRGEDELRFMHGRDGDHLMSPFNTSHLTLFFSPANTNSEHRRSLSSKNL